jgi:small-conductance mechanosensitive channel
MMAGMALQLEHAVRVGDWIKFDGQEGLVKEVRWRHTAIETRNWDTIVIPNSALMKTPVTVLGSPRRATPSTPAMGLFQSSTFVSRRPM